MSAAAAAVPADAGGAKPAKGKKKLIMIIAVALVVLLGGGAAAMVLLKKKPAAGEDGEEAPAHATEHKSEHKIDAKHPPTFVALEPFVVNLADKDTERYAQIGITLEVEDEKFGEQMKAFMPAIRNGILMILAHKSAAELQGRPGKEKLAGQIQRETGRTMGLDIDEPDPEDEEGGEDADGEKKVSKEAAEDTAKAKAAAKKKKKKKKKAADDNPVRNVLFSNFIIQ